MSYILDALKKAEKDRKRSTVPDLITEEPYIIQKPKRYSKLIFILVISLFFNFGILFWWLNPWNSKKIDNVSNFSTDISLNSSLKNSKNNNINNQIYKESEDKKTDATHIQKIKSSEDKSLIESNLEIKEIKQEEKSEVKSQKIEIQHPAEKTKDEIHKQQNEVNTEHPTKLPSSLQKGITVDKPSERTYKTNRVLDIEDLPLSVQQSLPPINISIFVYSEDPASRIVKINGQSVREGNDLAEGLKVEKILPDCIIFDYEGYRFRYGIR